jgi:hypothetical protein
VGAKTEKVSPDLAREVKRESPSKETLLYPS